MTAPSPRAGVPLYSPEILGLAVELANHPLDQGLSGRGEATSRVCGSRIAIGLATTSSGAIERVGAHVTACAIGQAAAALFLRSAPGNDREDVARAAAMLGAWLKGDDTAPDWPGLTALAPARSYPARHAAILLPWEAALDALSKHGPAG